MTRPVAKLAPANEHDAVPPLPPVSADFDELFRHHAPTLLRIIRARTGDIASADDVLQETFVRFYRFYIVPGRFDTTRSVGPLLATIATREAARRGRLASRQRQIDAAARPVVNLDHVGTDDHVAALDDKVAVHAALEALHPRQRRLLLEWESRHSTEALAVTEQVSVPALKQVVIRARRTFRARYREASAEAGGFGLPVLLPLILRVRARLRLNPVWHDIAAAGVAVAACAAAALVPPGNGGTSVRTQDAALVSNNAIALPPTESTLASPAQARRSVDFRVATLSVAHPGDQAHIIPPATPPANRRGAAIDIASRHPERETRSINSFTVACDAGTTAALTCTALDNLPSALSRGGNP